MHQFYQPELQNGLLELSEEEARHAVRVLRLNSGDVIEVSDGRGVCAKAELTEVSKKTCAFRILAQSKEVEPLLPKIAIAPTKNIDRFEWFLEKAVEIGVSEICPILCSNSERRVLKSDRSEKILLSAMKQSQRNWLPSLHELTPYADFIVQATEPMLIAHCRDAQKVTLTTQFPTNAWILIGPEGDFTKDEIDMALKTRATEIDLGKNRLRTETAGIFALSVMNYLRD